jgi:hypothetical protein
MGDPRCYKERSEDGHSLQFNKDQLLGQAYMHLADLRFQIQEQEQYIHELQKQDFES